MFQTFLLSLMALFGFTPATSQPVRVGPGPTGRRRAIHRVAQAVAQPVAQPDSPVVQPAAAREAAHRMGVRTTGLVRKIPAGRAVRWLQHEAGCAPSDIGLPGVTQQEVELSLGADLIDYVGLCLRARHPIPPISPSQEHANDAIYRVRLQRAMLDDVELWEATAIVRDRQRAEALAAGVAQPPALRIPAEVEAVIAQKAAAQLALLRRRKETQGGAAGAAGKGGSNIVSFPAGDQAPAPDGPPPEGHDADVATVPGLK